MSTNALAPDYLREQLLQLQARNGAPDWLDKLRRTGLDCFNQLGFPTTRMEDWRFTDIRPIREGRFSLSTTATMGITAADIAPYTYDRVADTLLVFVDGWYCQELSCIGDLPEGVTIRPLGEVLAGGGTAALKQYLASQVSIESNAFAALNTGLVTDGAMVHIPAGLRVEKPIHLLYLASGETNQLMMHPRNLVVAERQAAATILESYVGLGTNTYWCNAVTELILSDNAAIDHYRTQQESPAAYHTSTTQVRLGRDATFTSHAVTDGASITRNDVNALLDGENGVCTLNGLYLGSGRQLVDNHTTIEHAKPHCQSYEIYKGILDDRAAGVFNGRIHVLPDAQLTNAKQTNRALLLSDKASINTKPELLIFADDVKCTHGATIGQLDEAALFYLRARGIHLDHARAILTAAFGGEAIDDMKLDAVREAVSRMMLHRFTPRSEEG